MSNRFTWGPGDVVMDDRKLKLDDLYTGVEVTLRTGRYQPDTSRPDWTPWRRAILRVTRSSDGLPRLIAIENEEWAEYTLPQVFNDGVFANGDYYMEIKGLES